MTHRTMSGRSTKELHLALVVLEIIHWCIYFFYYCNVLFAKKCTFCRHTYI